MGGINENCVICLHCNGADEATAFPDASPLALTYTAHGNAQVDTAVKKWGSGSALFDGVGDYIDTPYNAAFDMGTGDFTFDFQVINPNGGAVFAARTTGTANNYMLYGLQSGQMTLQVNGSDYVLTFTANPADASWHHIKVCRASGVVKGYCDGESTNSQAVAGAVNSTGVAFTIGGYAGSGGFSGQIDEFRALKGEADSTGDFTSPIAEYNPERTITEAITLDDTFDINQETITEGIGLGDTFTLSDSSKTITEGIGLGDTFVISDKPVITEAIALNDTITLQMFQKILTEAVSLTDEFIIEMQNNFYRKVMPVNLVGKRISLKFENNTAGNRLLLMDGIYQGNMDLHRNTSTDTENTSFMGKHISLKFQNSTVDETILLEYVKADMEKISLERR